MMFSRHSGYQFLHWFCVRGALRSRRSGYRLSLRPDWLYLSEDELSKPVLGRIDVSSGLQAIRSNEPYDFRSLCHSTRSHRI